MRPDNPVRGITRFADGRRERRLSDTDYKMFGAANWRRGEPATLARRPSGCTVSHSHGLAPRGGAWTALG